MLTAVFSSSILKVTEYEILQIKSYEGIVRQITVNDLPVGRSVDEVKRLVQGMVFNKLVRLVTACYCSKSTKLA